MPSQSNIRRFRDIRLGDIALVGGKNASLGELYSVLSAQGVRVPNGFALDSAGLSRRAHRRVSMGSPAHPSRYAGQTAGDILAERATEARKIVFQATGGGDLRQQMAGAYRQLEAEYGSNVAVAVRSSVTAEDLPTASFAGQYDSFLSRRGEISRRERLALCRPQRGSGAPEGSSRLNGARESGSWRRAAINL